MSELKLLKTKLNIRDFKKNDAEYEQVVEIHNANWPNLAVTVEEWKHDDKTRNPQYLFQRLVVELEEKIVAYGDYGEPGWSYKPGKYFIDGAVYPMFQQRGIGTALYDHIRDALVTLNPLTLVAQAFEDKPESIKFLEQRGFELVMRYALSQLDVRAFDQDKFSGISEKMNALNIKLHSFAELDDIDPDWKRNVWDLAWELVQDVPSPDPMTRQPFEQWLKRFDAPYYLADAQFVAMDANHYVGYSGLWLALADREKLYTGLTGVVRSQRRKGIATAAKVRGIEYAKQRGIKFIETDNEENNPMYDLNVQLGFTPLPAELDFKKVIDKDTGMLSITPVVKDRC